METKKISLTPNLLRDEVNNNNNGSPTEAKDVRRNFILAKSGPYANISSIKGPWKHGSHRQGP